MAELAIFYPIGHEAHQLPGHPERPERVRAIRNALVEAGYWDGISSLPPLAIDDDVLFGTHTRKYINVLKTACDHGAHLDADTYTTPASWGLALNAAGGALAVANNVWGNVELQKDNILRGFAITRPPGHHATAERGMGFCLLNNIALAAEFLIQQKGARRLAIIDLDLHHGNGTQDIFWSRNDVFYISTHQSPLYPGTGNLDEIGIGDGEGFTANFPLPPATGDQGFTTIMNELILPLVDDYQPEMILVSYGFDPHWRDPLGHLQLSADGYGGLISKLVYWSDRHCEGRIAIFLEGGYDLDAGYACTQAITSALLGKSWVDQLGPSPRTEGNSWRGVFDRAKKIWIQ